MKMTEKDYDSFLYTSLKMKYYRRYKPETARKKAKEEYIKIKEVGNEKV